MRKLYRHPSRCICTMVTHFSTLWIFPACAFFVDICYSIGHLLLVDSCWLLVIFQCNPKWRDFYGKQYDASFIDGLVKSRKTPFFVIPAKAGIQ